MDRIPPAGVLYQGPKFLILPLPKARHCEERSDEAIQGRSTVRAALDCRAAKWRLAMTTVNIGAPGIGLRRPLGTLREQHNTPDVDNEMRD
jgi:hypothetical protein